VRVRLALFSLAVGGFGIGATEFVAMGVLPQIAADLLPDLWLTAPDEAIARAGLVISAYALGVVVGAPLIAATLARFPRNRLLIGFAAFFTFGSVASAPAPTFELTLVARFIAGLPHGAYFGIAALVAASLMGEGRRGRGVAFVLSGLTIANVVGVPLITWLGQVAGWRASYLVVAAIFLATTILVAIFLPAQPGDPEASFRRELGALRRGQVWLALLIGSVGFGGFFAVYSYVAPLVTDVAGLSDGFVPWALVLFGIGMTVGNLIGGRLADLRRGHQPFGAQHRQLARCGPRRGGHRGWLGLHGADVGGRWSRGPRPRPRGPVLVGWPALSGRCEDDQLGHR